MKQSHRELNKKQRDCSASLAMTASFNFPLEKRLLQEFLIPYQAKHKFGNQVKKTGLLDSGIRWNDFWINH